ncbi:MAG: hypothetical protein KDH88_19595 [Chromatiales bacterium]|nr:hypothetical protein [Chromatiales bacterium]
MKAITAGALAAVLIQPLVLALQWCIALAIRWSFGGKIAGTEFQTVPDPVTLGGYVLVVASVFVGFVGIPAFLTLKRRGKLAWGSALAVGFLAAAVPYGVVFFPLWQDVSGQNYGARWHGELVPIVVDGVYTPLGWLRYLESSIRFGIHGLTGAAVFFLVWRRLSKPSP